MVRLSKSNADLPKRRRSDVETERLSNDERSQQYTFRRNRTLTGSVSSKVTTTNEANATMKSPRVQTHILTQRRRHIGLILTLVATIVGALTVLIWQFTASVTVRAAGDASLQLDPVYAQAIETYLTEQPVERLRFVINMNHLTKYLQSVAPEVASVENRGYVSFGTTQFAVTMRKPIAGWNVNGKQRYVDTTGTSFARNYFTSPAVQIVDKSGIQVAAGQAVASNRFLGFVGQIVGLAQRQGFTVSQVIIPPSTTRQVELRLKGVGYPVKLSIDRPSGEQIEDMARAIDWMAKRKQTPQYIDVRVSGKAYYR